MNTIPQKRDQREIAGAILRQAREIYKIAERTPGETSALLVSAGDTITREAESINRFPDGSSVQDAGELKRAGHAIARETELLKQVSFHAPGHLSVELTRVIAIISCRSEEIRDLFEHEQDQPER